MSHRPITAAANVAEARAGSGKREARAGRAAGADGTLGLFLCHIGTPLVPSSRRADDGR